MQKFKFRAKRPEVLGGGYIYGSLIYRYGKVYIEDALTHETVPVEEESIAQLVGYIPAPSGLGVQEVYEGDELDNGEGKKIYASILRFVRCEKGGGLDFDEMAKEYHWTLKN